MHVDIVDIAKLVLDPANARRHSAKNLEAIKGSLVRFGQQKPIVITPAGVVLAGNGTLEAARSLGWDKIDCVRTKLEGTDATAYAIADNRTGELAEWDAGALSETLKSLAELDFDLGSIGFDETDLAAMIATPEPPGGLTDPDAVPEQVEPRTKPGDLWVLGEHRLLCGDSTNVQHVERLMAGEKATFVYCDPPYGMKLDADYKTGKGPGIYSGNDMRRASGVTHRDVVGDHDDFTPDLIQTVFASFGYCSEIFLWGADYYAELIPDRATQKPVALAAWFFERWGKPRDLVADLYLGSGSTLIACEKTGRRCFGMEIDPHYCDVIVARWEQFTGNTAILMSEEN